MVLEVWTTQLDSGGSGIRRRHIPQFHAGLPANAPRGSPGTGSRTRCRSCIPQGRVRSPWIAGVQDPRCVLGGESRAQLPQRLRCAGGKPDRAAGTSDETVDAITSEGAEVVQTDLIYDEVVWAAASSTAGHPEDLLVQDTAWQGYEQIPQWIVDGYGTLFGEIGVQLMERAVHLVAVPTGVGSLVQAALQHYRNPVRDQQPAIITVEPVMAACVTVSLAAGRRVRVDTSAPTIMAGLNCGTISTIAWPAIRDGLDASVTVTDDDARSAMYRLNELGVPAGPCGGSALVGVRAALSDPDRRAALRISEQSAVVLISTDGST